MLHDTRPGPGRHAEGDGEIPGHISSSRCKLSLHLYTGLGFPFVEGTMRDRCQARDQMEQTK